MVFIIVKAESEGIHRYPDAPQQVAFLRDPHRHIFKVEVEIEVRHDDRELEFIMVKDFLTGELTSMIHPLATSHPSHLPIKYKAAFNAGTYSCELLARAIQYLCKEAYGERKVNVKVFEDGENGVYLTDE